MLVKFAWFGCIDLVVFGLFVALIYCWFFACWAIAGFAVGCRFCLICLLGVIAICLLRLGLT